MFVCSDHSDGLVAPLRAAILPGLRTLRRNDTNATSVVESVRAESARLSLRDVLTNERRSHLPGMTELNVTSFRSLLEGLPAIKPSASNLEQTFETARRSTRHASNQGNHSPVRSNLMLMFPCGCFELLTSTTCAFSSESFTFEMTGCIHAAVSHSVK